MPKGLAFLSKKSFHTSKLCNQEKVWIAEQEKAAEDVKIKELAKQIQQEREEEELQRISGTKSKRLDRGIDWMYQHGGGSGGAGGSGTSAFEEEQKKKEAEEYLLGKEYNPSNVKTGDLAVAESNVGLNAVVTQAANPIHQASSIVGEESKPEETQDWKSDFHLRYEDPMYLVEQQRKNKEKEEERKRKLFERVNDDGNDNDNNYRAGRGKGRKKERSKNKKERSKYNDDDEDDDYKRHRRDDHRDRKRRKKERRREERRRRSYSYDSEDSAKRHHRHSRSRRDRKYSNRERDRERSFSRSRSRSRSRSTSISHGRRSPARDYRRDDESRRSRRNESRYESRRRDKSRSRSYDRGYDRRDRSRSRERRRERDNDTGSRGGRYREHESSRYHDEKIHDNKRTAAGGEKHKSYGLIGGSSSNSKSCPTGYLGPDQKLIAQKRREKDEQRNRYNRNNNRGGGSISGNGRSRTQSRSTMTEEERMDALRSMQADATMRSDHLSLSKRTSNAELYEEEIRRRKEERNNDGGSNNNQASFVQETTLKAHGIENKSLSARVDQSRSRRQRTSDDSFL